MTKRIDRCSRAVFERPGRDPDGGVSHIQLPRRFPGPLTSFGKRRVRLHCCVRGVEENHFALLLNPSMSTEHTQAGERTGTLTRWSHPYVPYAHAHALAHAMHLLDAVSVLIPLMGADSAHGITRVLAGQVGAKNTCVPPPRF